MSDIFRIDFYPHRWIVDTQGMPPEHRGNYIQICMLIYAKGGPIDNDPKWIAWSCGCSSRLVRASVEFLLAKGYIKLLENGSKITQKRAESELNIKRKFLEHQSNAGRTSAEKRGEYRKNSELTSTPTPPHPTLSPEVSKKEGGGVTRAHASDPNFQKIYQRIENLFPHLAVSNSSPIKRWLERGFDTELDIIPAIEQVKEDGYAVGSISYFTKPINRLHLERKGENHGERKADDRRSPAARAIDTANSINARRRAARAGTNGDSAVEVDPDPAKRPSD